MDPLVIVAAVAALVLVGVLIAWERQRARRLQSQYGGEYHRTVDELGRLRAERELVNRERRVRQLNIRALTLEQRERFAKAWEHVQVQFVDDPAGAVSQGDRLVEDVMDARGYPIADFDVRLADLSVHHAHIVDDYRALRDIALRHRAGQASTEDLRQAMVHLRAVFDDLLEDREQAGEVVVEREVVRDDVPRETRRRGGRVRPDREMPA